MADLAGPQELLEQLTPEIPTDCDLSIEISRRLLRAAEIDKALASAPHAKDCHSQRDYHQPGFIHYETDADEPCPSYHFAKGKCNCWRAALGERPAPEMSRENFYHIAFDFLETHAPTVEELIGLLQSVARGEREQEKA